MAYSKNVLSVDHIERDLETKLYVKHCGMFCNILCYFFDIMYCFGRQLYFLDDVKKCELV